MDSSVGWRALRGLRVRFLGVGVPAPKAVVEDLALTPPPTPPPREEAVFLWMECGVDGPLVFPVFLMLFRRWETALGVQSVYAFAVSQKCSLLSTSFYFLRLCSFDAH